MTNRSIIFFDIDGTLYNNQKEVPHSTKMAVKKLKELGHYVAIATGRAPFMFKDLRDELDIHTFVSFNGQYVVKDGEVIYQNPLKLELMENLNVTALHNKHPVVYMTHEDMKANVPSHKYITESLSTLGTDLFPAHDPNSYKNSHLYQALLFCAEGEEKFYLENFPNLKFVRWHPYSCDVVPKGGSKANGIKKLIKQLEIDFDNVYAFGDGLNDIEMLTLVKNSVAMGNGVDEVKQVAAYVTKSVEDDGILHGLQMLHLL